MTDESLVNMDRLWRRLCREEGIELKMYTDTTGNVSIGVGRNLTGVGINKNEAMVLLRNDIHRAIDSMPHREVWEGLNEVRREVLVNMCFNLGATKLKGFKRMWVALSGGLFYEAANEMLDSKWSTQVGTRAARLSLAMRLGRF